MLDNRYQILQEIGSGGIGKVFKVTDGVTGETVALKVLLSQEAELVDRFKKEFLLLRRLDHPNIAKVYDFGISGGGEPFFTMEYIEAGDWKSFLQPLDYSKFWPLLLQICATLDFLHCQQIIHGDLKPSNILITGSAAGEPIPKFTDFGFAEYGEAKEPGWWKGTLSYLAPEVIRGEKYGCQADLYSLGLLIYETLFGKRPFDEEEPGELAKSHLEKEIIIPEQPPVTEGLKNLILKMLEKDPIDRCFSARDILDEVKTISGFQTQDLLGTLANGLISSGDFVGREEELSVLKEALEHASTGKSKPVLILGESGIGKTRLLEEFKARAQIEGASVLMMSLGSRESSEALGRWKVDLLDKISQPAVLIVEHLENADDAEFGFLRDLIDQAKDKKLLPCLSVTNESACSEKYTRASEIEKEVPSGRKGEITRIRLENLSEAQAGRLVCSMFTWKQKGDNIAARVYEKTKGNPLLIKGLMQSLVSEMHIQRRNGQWAVQLEQIDAAPVPKELARKIKGRLNRLNQDELDLLFTAAVLGLESEIDVLSKISGAEPGVFQKGLENVLADRILVPPAARPERNGVCFPDGFTRDFVYQQIDPTERRDLHRRVGRYLEEKGASETERPLDQLADHFYRAGDDAPALRYALAAAEKAKASGRTTQAIIQYLRVLELYDRCPSPPSKPKEELYQSLAEQYEADGSYEKGLHYFQKALELYGDNGLNSQKLAQIYRRMARIHGKKSEHEKSMQL
ncbi:MAG: protein kinase, partial [candidate division Zixibacteria bacterium]|nr:protein kinase [candidate division Zixibacteria bacterium]